MVKPEVRDRSGRLSVVKLSRSAGGPGPCRRCRSNLNSDSESVAGSETVTVTQTWVHEFESRVHQDEQRRRLESERLINNTVHSES